MSGAARDHDDSPQVTALRKMIRGDVLTDEDRRILARVSRRPNSSGEPLTQEQLDALLSERARGG